jgi:hypothetical protein
MDKGAKLSMTYNLNLLAFLISLIGQEDQEGQVGQGSSIGKPEPLCVPTTAEEGRYKAIHGRFIALNGKGSNGLKHRISSPFTGQVIYMGKSAVSPRLYFPYFLLPRRIWAFYPFDIKRVILMIKTSCLSNDFEITSGRLP